MSQDKQVNAETTTKGGAMKELAKDVAQVGILLGRIGVRLGVDTTVRASGTGRKAGERDRSKGERVVNSVSTAGFLGSLGYTLVTGDLTVGGAGMLASVGVRSRKQLKSGLSKGWNALKWVWGELDGEAREPKASD